MPGKKSLHLGPREIHGKKTIRTNSCRAFPPVASSFYPVTFQVSPISTESLSPKKNPNATFSLVSKTGVPSLPEALLIWFSLSLTSLALASFKFAFQKCHWTPDGSVPPPLEILDGSKNETCMRNSIRNCLDEMTLLNYHLERNKKCRNWPTLRMTKDPIDMVLPLYFAQLHNGPQK